MKTYIVGHTKPDTDAVVAAMATAYLFENASELSFSNPEAIITEELNPETSYLFEKFSVASPRIVTASEITTEDKIVLVDHNEESQRMTNLPEDQIVAILDHHKVNLNIASPIAMTFRPWGSSSTIVYHLMKNNGVTPSKEIATLMLCAILSDTVGYKSATTTSQDKIYGQELAQLAEIDDVDALTLEIFKAKSDISKLSDEQIVTNDYKVFDFGKKTFINQIETVQQEELLSSKTQDLLLAMQAIKEEQKVDLVFVAITDILNVNTKVLVLSDAEAEVAQKAFDAPVENHIINIGPRMSRKKEIAPAIEAALK